MAKVFSTNPAAGGSPSISAVPPAPSDINWREMLPTLSSTLVTLREPTDTDALPLLTALSASDLAQVTSDAPPMTEAGLQSLITTMTAKRTQGAEAWWVVVPRESGAPVGVIRVRSLDHGFTMVEGTAAIAEEFRGTHVFQDAARLVLGCLFRTMQVHRAEFRTEVRNARANGALRKLGATQEGLLRRAVQRDGEFIDQVLWSVVATDWNSPRAATHPRVH